MTFLYAFQSSGYFFCEVPIQVFCRFFFIFICLTFSYCCVGVPYMYYTCVVCYLEESKLWPAFSISKWFLIMKGSSFFSLQE